MIGGLTAILLFMMHAGMDAAWNNSVFPVLSTSQQALYTEVGPALYGCTVPLVIPGFSQLVVLLGGTYLYNQWFMQKYAVYNRLPVHKIYKHALLGSALGYLIIAARAYWSVDDTHEIKE